jgi:hypothetical protein
MPWTVPYNALLCERHTRCTLCGGPHAPRGGAYRWEGHEVFGVTLGVLLCAQCATRDPECQQLRQLLEARYQGCRSLVREGERPSCRMCRSQGRAGACMTRDDRAGAVLAHAFYTLRTLERTGTWGAPVN